MRKAYPFSNEAPGDMWGSCVPARTPSTPRKGHHARPSRTREAARSVPSMVPAESTEGACSGGAQHGSAQGRFVVTSHAVNSYRRRLRGGIDYDRALRELVSITSAGRFVELYRGLRFPQFEGVRLELWRGPRIGPNRYSRGREANPGDPRDRLRFVVAYGNEGLPQVVSVLPIGRRWQRCK